jgi:CheY-like chemotaxis protein
MAVAHQPDAIILDIILPDLNGWEVLEELKKTPQTQHIPVMIASMLNEERQGLQAGATTYLVKPFSRQQFLQTLLSTLQTKKESAQPPAPAANGNSKTPNTILLAEDHKFNLTTLTDFLTKQGYNVVTATNGVEAINQAKQTLPNLILMDIQMPEMDGLEAIRHLRTDATFQTMPIIALTALAMPGDRERCLEAGANDYISKPISLKHLTKTIHAYLH